MKIVCFLVATAAGITATLAYPGLWPWGWVCLWPLFDLLERHQGWRRRLLLGGGLLLLVAQLGFPYAIQTADRHLGGGRPLAAWMMGTTLGVVTSLRYLLFCLLARRPQGRPDWRGRLNWACWWTALELWVWQMMPVYSCIHVQGDLLFLQWGQWIGATGLTFLWVGLSLWLYQAARGLTSWKPPVMLWLLIHGVGGLLYLHWDSVQAGAPVHPIAVIQGNLPPDLAQDVDNLASCRRQMVEQTAAVGGGPAVVVWPEASLPPLPAERVGGVQLENGRPLIYVDAELDGSRKYVVARALDGGGRHLATYRKRKLILMGEWTPWSPQTSLSIGNESVLLPTPCGPALPLICFEGLWSSFAARFHRDTQGQARWLVHMTSEASFGSPLCCEQSCHLAALRAIELRRPVVRAANAGVSGWVDVMGRLHQATAVFRPESVTLQVGIAEDSGLTLFAQWGDLPMQILLLLGLGLSSFIASGSGAGTSSAPPPQRSAPTAQDEPPAGPAEASAR